MTRKKIPGGGASYEVRSASERRYVHRGAPYRVRSAPNYYNNNYNEMGYVVINFRKFLHSPSEILNFFFSKIFGKSNIFKQARANFVKQETNFGMFFNFCKKFWSAKIFLKNLRLLQKIH